MSNIFHAQAPVLQAAGKGLPKFELFMARMIVGWKSRRTSRAESADIFQYEKEEIIGLARRVDPEVGSQPVLIKRLRGLEDSSRFWSIYMVLDHLRIVNREATDLIGLLVRGERPRTIMSTAAVKPSNSANATAIDQFESACNCFQKLVKCVEDLQTTTTWAHPWFGQLNAEQWHFFTGFHMNLHRRQIMAIQAQNRDGTIKRQVIK